MMRVGTLVFAEEVHAAPLRWHGGFAGQAACGLWGGVGACWLGAGLWVRMFALWGGCEWVDEGRGVVRFETGAWVVGC